MNWISNVVRPRIRSFLTTKREVPDNLWIKCPESGQMVFHKDLEANQFVVPGSNYHMRMAAADRLRATLDDGAYAPISLPAVPSDPLKFRDERRYVDRLKDAKAKTELSDAVLVGEGRLDGAPVVVAAQDFRFMGGSLGMAAGEAVIAGMLRACEINCPFILFAASGGARMQEGILSLMQMPRTTIAVQRLRDAGLPYIVVMTDPTTGGVTASYAMLGDVHIAEPGALICFAGPRVIEQTIREQLPDGFQRAEYLLEHGMIDMVVHRHDMRETLGRLCRLLGPSVDAAEAIEPSVPLLTSPRDDDAAPEDVAAVEISDAAADGEVTTLTADTTEQDAATVAEPVTVAVKAAAAAAAAPETDAAATDAVSATDANPNADANEVVEAPAAPKTEQASLFNAFGLAGSKKTDDAPEAKDDAPKAAAAKPAKAKAKTKAAQKPKE